MSSTHTESLEMELGAVINGVENALAQQEKIFVELRELSLRLTSLEKTMALIQERQARLADVQLGIVTRYSWILWTAIGGVLAAAGNWLFHSVTTGN